MLPSIALSSLLPPILTSDGGLGSRFSVPIRRALLRLFAFRRPCAPCYGGLGCAIATRQAADQTGEAFQGLLLRHRGRTGLTQRELAARVGVSKRTLQDWEAGVSYPGVERLQALIAALLAAGGQALGHETLEAQELWSAALREAPRLHTPFDPTWFAELLHRHTASSASAQSLARPY